MDDLWQRIEGWLQKNAPDVAKDLNAGASDEALAKVESLAGVRMPPDLRASYHRHDGQRGSAKGVFGAWEWLSLRAVEVQWTGMKRLLDAGKLDAPAKADPGVQPLWWNAKWIPFAHNGAGDLQCVDLDPGASGLAGQIVTFLHADRDRVRQAASFREYLERFARDLESGAYVPHRGGLKRRA